MYVRGVPVQLKTSVPLQSRDFEFPSQSLSWDVSVAASAAATDK